MFAPHLRTLLIAALCLANAGRAQQVAYQPATPKVTFAPKDDDGFYKAKPISFTAIGYLAPLNEKDIVIGGTSTVFKRFGSFLAYKMGIHNYSLPSGTRGEIIESNIIDAGCKFTGNYQHAVTLMLSTGLTFTIWKKMPIYVGIGATRYRYFFEYEDVFDNNTLKWNLSEKKTGFQLNYTAGFFLPLGRLLLNVGYDHNPQSVFIGVGIRAKDAYKDIDEWR